MDTEKKEMLMNAGIDVDGAMERFLDNEMLLDRFLKKFLTDANFEKLREAVASGDGETAVNASHTLKGICGNLSMSRLYELFSDQVAAFRAGDAASAAALMEEIVPAYEDMCDVIRRNVGE